MRLLNNVGYATSRFRINLSCFDNVLHMLFDIIVLKNVSEDIHKIDQIFLSEKLASDLSIRASDKESVETFISVVLNKIEDKILDNISLKAKDHVIYVNKSEVNRSICSYISDGSRVITTMMVSNEIQENIIANFSVEAYIKEFIQPHYKVLYEHIINLSKRSSVNKHLLICEDMEEVSAYPVCVAEVDLSRYTIVEADPDIIVFNPLFLKDVLNITSDEWQLYEVIDGTKTIGLIVNDKLLPLIEITESILIEERGNYVWQLIKNVYGARSMQKRVPNNIQLFLRNAMNPSLNKLLTYLKCNFYLPEDFSISRMHKKYFELVYFYDKIERVDNLQICTNAKSKGTNLGIYTPEKKDKAYNLLHWYTGSTDELRHYNSEGSWKPGKATKIQVLKPPYNYYLLHKYFEDVMATCLDEIGVEYVKNVIFKLTPDQQSEADFIVKLEDKLLILEAKTRLSETTIKDALDKKVTRMRERFGDTFNNYPFEYVICAQFADERLGFIEHFMTKVAKSPNKQYNNLWSYDFYIGEGELGCVNQVRCISEPNIQKLKKKLVEICKK